MGNDLAPGVVLGERVLRGAAAPAVALGLGTAGGACDGGMSLAGGDPDTTDAGDAIEDVIIGTVLAAGTLMAWGKRRSNRSRILRAPQ